MIAFQNRRWSTRSCSKRPRRTIVADPRHLGAEPHRDANTGQTLTYHPHCIASDLASFAHREMPAASSLPNEQSSDIFAAEQRCVEESAPPIVWRRPSEHDADRLGDPLERVVTSESHIEHFEVVGAGACRGVILHKLMEELLSGDLVEELDASVYRARELLNQLVRR